MTLPLFLKQPTDSNDAHVVVYNHVKTNKSHIFEEKFERQQDKYTMDPRQLNISQQ